jgi:hypothetical protein
MIVESEQVKTGKHLRGSPKDPVLRGRPADSPMDFHRGKSTGDHAIELGQERRDRRALLLGQNELHDG